MIPQWGRVAKKELRPCRQFQFGQVNERVYGRVAAHLFVGL